MNDSVKWFIAGFPLIFAACAGPSQEAVARMEAEETGLREEVEDLKRAVNASYDRERALAERLQITEESNAQLRRELEEQIGQLGSLQGKLDTLTANAPAVPPVAGKRADTGRASSLDIPRRYEAARALYGDRQYERAAKQFAAILSGSPGSDLADNAQYWIGECYYGLGRFRQALTEFTKVFAYRQTEKDDDAQLKIARCYLSLGEKDRALMALQKLIDEHPKSEYGAIARREIRYLRGP